MSHKKAGRFCSFPPVPAIPGKLSKGKDYFLLVCYHSNGTGICLNSCKMIKVSFGELKEPELLSERICHDANYVF